MNQPEAADRYARHRLIGGWRQERLRDAKVIVAGGGAIGNEVIKLLALLGIGHVLIIDFDTVEVSNLSRCVLFRSEDVGRPKAVVAAQAAAALNPEISVSAIVGDVEFDVGLGVFRAADIVIGCLDSLQARLALNRACLRAGRPWLNGAIEYDMGEVSLFSGVETPCFECAMSAEMWARRNVRFSCGGLRAELAEAPAPTTAVTASIAAAYLAQEALFMLHAESADQKEGLQPGQKLSFRFSPYDSTVYTLAANPECLAHESALPIEVIEASPDVTSGRALLGLAGECGEYVELGFDLLTEMVCVSCGARESVFRPVERCTESLVRCPVCAAESRQPETVSWLNAESEAADIPLKQLGLPSYAVLAVHNGSARRYFQLSGDYRF